MEYKISKVLKSFYTFLAFKKNHKVQPWFLTFCSKDIIFINLFHYFIYRNHCLLGGCIIIPTRGNICRWITKSSNHIFLVNKRFKALILNYYCSCSRLFGKWFLFQPVFLLKYLSKTAKKSLSSSNSGKKIISINIF